MNSARFEATTSNVTLANGAILVDEYDPIIFDDVLRDFPVWNLIKKIPAVGDFTNGFDQTDVGAAHVADKRALSYSATSPTRTARTPKEIKAIVRDLTFGLYDRSVYAQQGRKFGDLDAKDVRDCYVSCLRLWNQKFYTGDVTGDPLEFDGLNDTNLIGLGSIVEDNESIVKAIKNKVVAMINTSSSDVMPTHVIVNAQAREYISQEYRKDGDKFPESDATFGQGANARTSRVQGIDTAAGFLPIVMDKFNTVYTGSSPNWYNTYIISADKLSWQYVEPLGMTGPDPKLFEIAQTNALDVQHKCVMFGALELLGGTTHHARLRVEARTTVISPTA